MGFCVLMLCETNWASPPLQSREHQPVALANSWTPGSMASKADRSHSPWVKFLLSCLPKPAPFPASRMWASKRPKLPAWAGGGAYLGILGLNPPWEEILDAGLRPLQPPQTSWGHLCSSRRSQEDWLPPKTPSLVGRSFLSGSLPAAPDGPSTLAETLRSDPKSPGHLKWGSRRLPTK